MNPVVRNTIESRDPAVLLERAKASARQALAHLDKGEVRLAQECLKATLAPERLRWSDQ